ncbi:hypothetical protein [Allosalinactinospora lopnorensis]|uniref:hypothetical protein n=1 Tax=Allosalinactinospora lopnorensis TaxID=1352348 RepID=UPI00069790E6|nr:hypothetical protein [Allosalinactinospora lopnorensis]
MGVFVLTIVLSLVLFLPVAIRPRIWWELSHWQYRNPEANEPSEDAFLFRRIVAVVSLLLFPGLGYAYHVSSVEAEERAEQRAEERDERLERVNEGVIEGIENAESRDLELEPGEGGRSGHLLGYEGDADAETLTVVYELSPCGRLDEASVEEGEDEVEVRPVESRFSGSFDDACRSSHQTGPGSREIELDKPLRDRRVVLPAGRRFPNAARRARTASSNSGRS